eukprot:Skav233308  [mRNA]  locus=scaffold4193:88579:93795:+ [translate_table: standard]
MLKASHVIASDGYYDWYAKRDLKPSKCVYHICGEKRRQCKEKLVRGDRREVVHVEKWRMLTPLAMMDTDYLKVLGRAALEEWVRNFAPTVPEPRVGPGAVPPVGGPAAEAVPVGTGLDRAVDALEFPPANPAERRVRPEDKKEKAEEKKPRGSVGSLLEQRAAAQRELARQKEKKKAPKERGRSRSKRRRDRRSSSEERSTGSSSRSLHFHKPPSGVGDELWRLSEKSPGRLLKKGMKELQRYLASRSETMEEGQEDQWMKNKMMAYVNQVILSQHPQASMGVRNYRELVTVGTSIALLLEGKLPELGDLLMQRMKALESALNDQSWSQARHEELIPPMGASLTSEVERRRAAKQELTAAKLKEMTLKNRGGEGLGGRGRPLRLDPVTPLQLKPRSQVEEERKVKIQEGHQEILPKKPERVVAGGGKRSQVEEERKVKIQEGHQEILPKKPERVVAAAGKRQGEASSLGSRQQPVETQQERERKRPRQEQRKSQDQEPDPNEEGGFTTAESFEVDEKGKEAVEVLRSWLRQEDAGNLSAAQSGAYRSGTGVGEYLSRCVPGPSGERTGRQRSLLPLPLLADSRTELQHLFETGEFRKIAGSSSSKKKLVKEKAARAARRAGLLIWHGLVTTLINVMWTGGGKSGRIHQGAVSKGQEKAQERLWETVKRFLDDTSETTEKVPRGLATGEWGAKLGDVRISYHGEVVEKGQRLTLAQILPGLPPPGYGGSVPLIELVDGELKRRLENPESNLLPREELPETIPAPRVHADKPQWEAIARELYARGLVEPAEDPLIIDGAIITNGAFGVVKPGKYLEDERPVLRLIMDFRGVNSVTRVLEGDVRTLTGAPSLQHVVLPGSKVLRVSADDLISAFYLFSLPPGWSRMMTFGPQVDWKVLGVDKPGSVHIGARVLPMGWSSAVGILQHAHRRLALRSPLAGGAGLLGQCEIRRDSIFPDLEVEESLWSLYLDDMSLIEIMEKKVAEELKDKVPEEQDRLRKAYAHWGIPYSLGKAAVRAAKAEKLGSVIDGDAGLLKSSTKRALDSISLGAWILRQEKVPRKALQVFLGKETHTIQFRRPLFAIFDYLWKDIGEGEPMVEIGPKSVEEILLAGFSQPLRYTNLRASLNEVVTASDASESGGGLVHGCKLTSQGLRDALAAESGLDDPVTEEADLDQPQKILVIDCFAGIGGLSRALELAGVNVARLVVIEKDVQCRHLHRVRWPGCDVWPDITKVEKKQIEKVMREVPGLTGVICGGGSPCQGLSKLSSERTHLEDSRSKLFYNMVDIANWVEQISLELKVWCLNFVENVEADLADVKQMTEALGYKPVKACSSHCSRVRRPRLFWGSIQLRDHPSYTRFGLEHYHEVVLAADPEPLDKVPDEGWRWKAAEKDGSLKLPTFTRAIPRSRPPPSPAGIARCDEETLKRWRRDKMKFPPYTYGPEYLFSSKQLPGQVRVASAEERERMMGFRTGYTKALFKKEVDSTEERAEQEVCRQAALGNSFHTVVVAALLDLWLWSAGCRTDPVGIKEIAKRAHADLALPPMGPCSLREADAESEGAASESEVREASELSPQRVEWLRLSQDPNMGWSDVKLLNVRLIHQFLRRAAFRGSDVRLDLQLAYRPDAVARTSINPDRWVWEVAQSYPWRQEEHINILELRAILRGLEWRARSSAFHSCRFLHLSDSQICLAVLAKGRSSSRRINRILRKVHALCLALDAYPLWAWIASRLNPADEPSRRYAKNN